MKIDTKSTIKLSILAGVGLSRISLNGDTITLSVAERRSIEKARTVLRSMARYRIKGARDAESALAGIDLDKLGLEEENNDAKRSREIRSRSRLLVAERPTMVSRALSSRDWNDVAWRDCAERIGSQTRAKVGVDSDGGEIGHEHPE